MSHMIRHAAQHAFKHGIKEYPKVFKEATKEGGVSGSSSVSISGNEIEVPKNYLLISASLALLTCFNLIIEMPKAQASIYSSCYNAYQLYWQSEGSLKISYLNTVTNCAINYADLVSQDTRYCVEAQRYMDLISPLMRTAAIRVFYSCQRE